MKPGTLRYNNAQPVASPKPMDETVIAHRNAKCAPCQWNFNWEACEHLDCKTCSGKQRRAGGLAIRNRNPLATCPIGLW